MKRFETGKSYYCRSVCDNDCIFTIKVLKRTDKTLTIVDDFGHIFKPRVKMSDDVEYVVPEKYSFAPVYRATSLV